MPKYKRYYFNASMVFVTVVTNKRMPVLTDNIQLLRESFKISKYKFKIPAGVVLPDHFHVIIDPQNISEIPKIIGSVKYHFSRNINIEVEKTKAEIKRSEKEIWQRRYYDHIIRDENDLYKHLDYIHYNPVKHKYVKAAKDWKYSSFNKFVSVGLYDEN